ncbi:MAG TPA: glycoside hydrolase family 36 protein [Paludibaculum sp.]|jgi:hypothetical protein
MEINSESVSIGYSAGAWAAAVGMLVLSGGWPEVGGRVFRDAPAQVTQDGSTITSTYDLGGDLGRFVVRAEAVTGGVAIQYSLSGVTSPQSISKFGLHFDQVAGLKRFYRSGYYSWDDSYFVQPDALTSFTGPELAQERSYAVTELVPAGDGPALVIGFDRHDRFQQTFTFGARKSPIDLSISTWWDRKSAADGNLRSERLLLLADSDFEEGMRRWARQVADASPTPPRKQYTPLVGWDTWYGLYNFISEPLVLDALRGVKSGADSQALPLKTFIVDAGFTPELGDWLKSTADFPLGMKGLTDQIRAAGYSPALWIAPLMVGNRSQLYHDHPDWVLQDARKPGPKIWGSFYGEQRLGNMRSEEYYVLDLSIPEVVDYLRSVFQSWKNDWGADSFKIDFSYVGAAWGPDEVTYRNPGRTRIELWRGFAEMVRREIGDDAIWVASGQPMWASVGLADTMRIAGDVGVDWSGNGPSALSLVQNLPYRNFANHILFQVDPDAILLRTTYHHLSDDEVQGLAVLAGMSGGALMTSDDFSQLPPERIAQWKMLLSARPVSCSYPRFGRDEIIYIPYAPGGGQPAIPIPFSDPVIVQVRALEGGDVIVHLLNTSEQSQQRRYAFADLGAALRDSGPKYVLNWWTSGASDAPVTQLDLLLPARAGTLLHISGERRQKPPGALAGDYADSLPAGFSRHVGGPE